MADKPTIYIVCSDRHRNGKTLLARVLVDYLMLEKRDPFVIDAGFPEGPLRAAFPGRTALVDFSQVQGQMKLFDTIMGSPGRDYVIDLPVPQTENFFATYSQLDFHIEATRAGFQIVVFFIVDKDYSSLRFSEDVQRQVAPALFIPVRNIYIGSALVPRGDTLSIDIPELDREVMNLIEARHFSLRNFILGDEGSMAAQHSRKLKIFLLEMMTALRDIEPAMTLARLRA
ncbi:MAG TPA: hypothetical protein PLK44_08705 [Aestuariivirga sp.]|nr:hypothetical protein [Hyphomicrobiales bacterium]MCC7481912.1 hypothetical protein [Hyphomicrobiales bacterium]HQY73778.1 hypothetical protein [Aestuariivirga sp.]HRA92835.1 hypothetical protein [Aestuariivirga sp.]